MQRGDQPPPPRHEDETVVEYLMRTPRPRVTGLTKINIGVTALFLILSWSFVGLVLSANFAYGLFCLAGALACLAVLVKANGIKMDRQ